MTAVCGTDWHEPFLETARCPIAVFRLDYEPERLADGTARPHKNYYVQESVGIAVGILLTALHTAGLATLKHIPSPMGFLAEILGRPKNERPSPLHHGKDPSLMGPSHSAEPTGCAVTAITGRRQRVRRSTRVGR